MTEIRYPIEKLDELNEDDGEQRVCADFGDVMELDVAWSCGNPFYYGYGFDIVVEPVN